MEWHCLWTSGGRSNISYLREQKDSIDTLLASVTTPLAADMIEWASLYILYLMDVFHVVYMAILCSSAHLVR